MNSTKIDLIKWEQDLQAAASEDINFFGFKRGAEWAKSWTATFLEEKQKSKPDKKCNCGNDLTEKEIYYETCLKCGATV